MEDYKKKLKEARLKAGKLMTEKQIKACNGIIHTAAAACAAAGGIPIPVADAIPISAAQITMIVSLGKTFGVKINDSAAKAIVGAAAASFVGRNLVKLIPIVGWGIAAGVAAGITEAIGWGAAVDFAKQYRNEYEKNKPSDASAPGQEPDDIDDDTEPIDPKYILNPPVFLFVGTVVSPFSPLSLTEKPDESSEVICSIPDRTYLNIYETDSDGWFMTVFEEKRGYVPAKMIHEIQGLNPDELPAN